MCIRDRFSNKPDYRSQLASILPVWFPRALCPPCFPLLGFPLGKAHEGEAREEGGKHQQRKGEARGGSTTEGEHRARRSDHSWRLLLLSAVSQCCRRACAPNPVSSGAARLEEKHGEADGFPRTLR
eukprot:TRINITY_DN37514_c0_g1_i1.p1 TRINITY_DN37514_c0_g1~~TRINITY_DN37514_c0_g1_i1.p1  ORF type:complete len:126 (+),score=13.86 TRINITY_DN37514_c0_g1_i1:33-410(+)